MNKDITLLSIGETFTVSSSDRYVIPLYQRNYAWKEKEIFQLIQDIYDFAMDDKKAQANYYIGTLVVYKRETERGLSFETIDGQQRLTTLNLLISAMKRLYKNSGIITQQYHLNLYFDSREKSYNTLKVITSDDNELLYSEHIMFNPDLQQGYRNAEKALKKLLKSEREVQRFYSFLVDNVKILRVEVPRDTDLNHYFEIMNNRGEQLEKHEILKAKMLELIHDDPNSTYTFNLIWEACADMERYVQYGFSVEERHVLFSASDWNSFTCHNFEVIVEEISCVNSDLFVRKSTPTGKISLKDIAMSSVKIHHTTDKKGAAPERFNSVINFSNFLLHVLRIQTRQDIPLDDKRLINSFSDYLSSSASADLKKKFVKEFGFNLLKCRLLFDQYIIKREYLKDKDQWSLKRLKSYKKNRVSYVNSLGDENDTGGVNKEVVMLLSMFHVSAPTLIYKHWLNASLKYLFDNGKDGYLSYLKNLAKAFLFDRFLTRSPKDYFEIIYNNEGQAVNGNSSDEIDTQLLNEGTDVENFIFNYLDYKLWKEGEVDGNGNFEFTFRSSVEHYYPQNPIAKGAKITSETCDNFGNLCLISSGKNSRLSNHLPESKKDFYYKAEVDSLKQRVMMSFPNWSESEIIREGKKMTDFLLDIGDANGK